MYYFKYGEKFYLRGLAYCFRYDPIHLPYSYRRRKAHARKGILRTIRNAKQIHPKARVEYYYWDSCRSESKSWKENTKCRYQWQKHLR